MTVILLISIPILVVGVSALIAERIVGLAERIDAL